MARKPAPREPLIQPGSFLKPATVPPPQEDLIATIIAADREEGGRAAPTPAPERKATTEPENAQSSKHVNMFTNNHAAFEESLTERVIGMERLDDLIPYTCRLREDIPLRLAGAVLKLKSKNRKVSQQSLINALLLEGLERIERELEE